MERGWPTVWTERGGRGVISPASSRGFLMMGVLGAALLTLGFALMVRQEAIGVLPLFFGGLLLRDAARWARLSLSQRERFVAYVLERRPPALALSGRLPLVASVPFVLGGAASAWLLATRPSPLALVGLIGCAVMTLFVLFDWLRAHITH
ncbi:MAG: hypothetical protein ACOZQL_03290 [Myxococcota bacterium]